MHLRLLVNDKDILEKCNKVWDNIKNLFQTKFDRKRVHNDKYIKVKINLYDKNFYGNKTPIKGEHYTCFFVILLDSFVNVDKKYHPQVKIC